VSARMSEMKRNENGDSELGADKIDDARGQGVDPLPARKPSQAEGDPETVDAALREQENEQSSKGNNSST
jgi:hypothetical protein